MITPAEARALARWWAAVWLVRLAEGPPELAPVLECETRARGADGERIRDAIWDLAADLLTEAAAVDCADEADRHEGCQQSPQLILLDTLRSMEPRAAGERWLSRFTRRRAAP